MPTNEQRYKRGIMENRLLHTPEGVRDIYADEMLKKMKIEDSLHRKINSFGFRDISTPTFEFFDIFSRDIGTTPSKEIFKFFDKENNTLALRPDFTPSVARAAVKYFEEELPIRLCYMGSTFCNSSDLQGRLKEVTELGAEYMGDASVEADAEMIALAVELLDAAGLKDYRICIGNAKFFQGLCEEGGIGGEERALITDYILDKNYFGMEDILNNFNMKGDIRAALNSLSAYVGGAEILESALKAAGNETSREAVKRLMELNDALKAYGIDDVISYDLGLMSGHDYYTGILFRAYTFGTGDAIVRGGRYDNLLGKFGTPKAAIGFTVVIDQIIETLRHQRIDIPLSDDGCLIVYEKASYEKAVRLAEEKRSQGKVTELILKSDALDKKAYEEHAKLTHSEEVIYL